MSYSVIPVIAAPADRLSFEPDARAASASSHAGLTQTGHVGEADIPLTDFGLQFTFMSFVFANQQLSRLRIANEERLRELRSED